MLSTPWLAATADSQAILSSFVSVELLVSVGSIRRFPFEVVITQGPSLHRRYSASTVL
ncbi:hypothetical protein [Piscirickettsia salmonis]|uniref:hypothetical protein n=1 Tax=Piscirickettsia salmonis TaxID=1238 RepID=UPI0012B823EE|nr:hypothetical protein [Piscirickettsia salmonis]QHS32515.1 hypothetical protein GW535_08455 [Piscirickettsia salmonis]QIX55935.1 hypothetical protein GW536_11355 [Piscirickettsia salmonis]